ncbi:MAG: hypothetical protein OXP69_22070 [Spirochaetaceae bacterium]|nr:hypothetical protein [Spirochaetaceae bacterium]
MQVDVRQQRRKLCYITSLDTKEDALEVVGGKGRSLAKLANAGFPVPGGFQVTTAAYRSFVADNELQARIVALARPAVVAGRASFEQSSAAIGQLFADTEISAEMSAAIREAYGALEGGAVAGTPALAVRSSANAEDLPGLSFAGQQETFLNVTGAEAVVAGVKNCWASLWTAQGHQLPASERDRPGVRGYGLRYDGSMMTRHDDSQRSGGR